MLTRAELIAQLAARDLIDASDGGPAEAPAARPWYVSLMLGAAGWSAGVFVLLFLGMILKPDTAPGAALTGIVLLAAAFVLYRAGRDSSFFDQLALAVSIAGQLALAWAAFDATDSAASTAWLILLLQVALVVVIPDRFAKALATCFACVAWAIAIRLSLSNDSFWYSEVSDLPLLPLALSWFVIWLPLVALTHILVKHEADWMAHQLQSYARPVLTGLIVSLALGTWLSTPLGQWSMVRSTHGSALLLAFWPLAAVAVSLLATTYAFRLRHRALLGITILGALLHLVQFYYTMGSTLLIKAAVMALAGVALLLAAALISRTGVRA